LFVAVIIIAIRMITTTRRRLLLLRLMTSTVMVRSHVARHASRWPVTLLWFNGLKPRKERNNDWRLAVRAWMQDTVLVYYCLSWTSAIRAS